MASRCLHLIAFLAGLIAMAIWVQRGEPMPFQSWARPKYEHVELRGDGYDTLFLGSSRFYYALDPAVFDARTRALGRPTRSFNLAVSGHRQHDVGAVVDWLLAHKPKTLRRVVIELHSFDLHERAYDWMSDQLLEMHTVRQFLPRCRSVLLSQHSWLEKLRQLWFVCAHTLPNELRCGQGPRILDDRLARERGQPLADRAWREGWMPIEEEDLPHLRAGREAFLADPAATRNVVALRVQDVAPPFLRGGFNIAAACAQAEALRRAGIEPIYVVMPTFVLDNLGRDGVTEFARGVRVFELDRPQLHRPLYEPELFYDASHFGTAGARVFSAYLAELVLECADRPVDVPPAPRAWPEQPMQLEASWVDGAIACRAENLPFTGSLVVVASTEPTDAIVNGLRVRVPLPPRWSCELARVSLDGAEGRLLVPGAPASAPVFLQLGVLENGAVVALGELVRVEPR